MSPHDDSTVATADDVVTQLLGFPIPTGTEIYDEIMRRLEPELRSSNLDHLDDVYAAETADERTNRYQRYSRAFKDYQKVYAVWSRNFRSAVKDFKRAVVKTAEGLSKEDEGAALTLLEEQMLTA